MHRQRYHNIFTMLTIARDILPANVVSKSLSDLKRADFRDRTALQSRSRATKNEIRTFIGSEHKMTPTKARLLEAMRLL